MNKNNIVCLFLLAGAAGCLWAAASASPAPRPFKVGDLIVAGSITLTSPDGKQTVVIAAKNEWAGIQVRVAGKSSATITADGATAFIGMTGEDESRANAFFVAEKGAAVAQIYGDMGNGVRLIELYKLPQEK